MKQLTNWKLPDEKVKVVDGKITFKQWLDREKGRIERDSDRQAEIRRRNKEIALFVEE